MSSNTWNGEVVTVLRICTCLCEVLGVGVGMLISNSPTIEQNRMLTLRQPTLQRMFKASREEKIQENKFRER
jgi:hypothetical protein